MRSFARPAAIAGGLILLSGCLAPWYVRLPMVYNRAPDVERIAQQYHDPYPDSQLGPSTGFRPLLYEKQRPLPVRIREKSDVTRLRGGGVITAPPVSPPPGSQYPAIVPF